MLTQTTESEIENIEISETHQAQNQAQNFIQKNLFLNISSSALGAGVGYLFGGLIKTLVDLSKIGMDEIQKNSMEENTKKYIGVNEYTISGLSMGMVIGAVTYVCISEFIRQRNEREEELQAVRRDIAESDNFRGALSERREVVNGNRAEAQVNEISGSIVNGDNQMSLVGADITINGDARSDLNGNPRSIMIVGEGIRNDENLTSIFQLASSREVSVDNLSSFDGSSGGFANLSPNIVFVMRPRGERQPVENLYNGSGQGQASIVGDSSLASPRGNFSGSQVEERRVEGKSGKFVLNLVKAIEEGRLNQEGEGGVAR
jgi:hypothetical protein